MGPFSEELQYKRAEAIERLLKNNPQLDAIPSPCGTEIEGSLL